MAKNPRDELVGSKIELHSPVSRTLELGEEVSGFTPFDPPHATRKVYVGTTGDLSVQLADNEPGTQTVFNDVPAGTMLDIRVTGVYSGATNALFLA